MNPYFITRQEQQLFDYPDVEIVFSGEMDEFWSFAGNKGNQRWTWYVIERRSGCMPAWHNGKRTDRDFLILWNSLKMFDIANIIQTVGEHIQSTFPLTNFVWVRIRRGKSSERI
ncbi:hypothetical protein EZS27_005868 [termite gut metagenome]|uniref:Uncharacterized protein n=1 Tax=termite gut metagenome TaxID=433724 RepID=A0A5J4SMN7_9ZZZZ